jgi:release factor glutamine methyltransferase
MTDADLVVRLRAAGCVWAEDEARLLLEVPEPERETLVMRRIAGEPLEHVLGWAEFLGHRVAVVPGVFVPRRRTEFLAECAVAVASPGGILVELCCGTAAVALAVASRVEGLEVHAADTDPVAAGCARRNLAAVGGHVHVGDLDAPLPRDLAGRVDVIVANAPYVPTGELELLPHEARDHEPRAALDGGPDGLDIQRRIASVAPAWLAPGGSLLIETSEAQASGTAAAMATAGLDPRIRRDRSRSATVVVGTTA